MRESQLRSRVRNGKTHFYANVNGEQIQLGAKKGAAEKTLKELLNGRPKQRELLLGLLDELGMHRSLDS